MNVTGGSRANKGMNDTATSHFRKSLGGKALPVHLTEHKRSISQLFAAEGVLFNQTGSIKTKLPLKEDRHMPPSTSQRDILKSQLPMQQILNQHQERHTRSSLNLGYGKLPIKNKSFGHEYLITDQESVQYEPDNGTHSLYES